MTGQQLTGRARLATPGTMQGIGNERGRKAGRNRVALLILASLALAGCITVNAPEEAIVIELNVNIRQEVIYRLAADAGNTIEENADIF
ncbi:YnbE family lipoprotein [Qipengyuania sp. SM2507]